MPKHFDTTQRELIHSKLIYAGQNCWDRFGIQRTRVDDLTRVAGISKGTFYTFFPSKELLFMEILESSHSAIKKQLIESLSSYDGSPRQRFINAILHTFHEIKRHPWLVRLFKDEGEYAHLVRNLPPERISMHIGSDESDTEQLMEALGLILDQKQIQTISAALRTLFTMLLHESEIGSDHMDDAFQLLLEGLATQIFGGADHDPR